MPMMGSQIILTGLILLILGKTFIGFKKKYLPRLFMIFWLAFWFGILFLTLNPYILSYIARIFGVGRGVDLAVYVSIILIFYLLYVLFIRIADLEKKLIETVRKKTLS